MPKSEARKNKKRTPRYRGGQAPIKRVRQNSIKSSEIFGAESGEISFLSRARMRVVVYNLVVYSCTAIFETSISPYFTMFEMGRKFVKMTFCQDKMTFCQDKRL